MAASLGFLGHPLVPRARQLATVIVALKTGNSIKGVLAEQARDALVLRAASQATVGQNSVISWQPLAGDVVIPLDNVDYWQAGLDPAIAAD